MRRSRCLAAGRGTARACTAAGCPWAQLSTWGWGWGLRKPQPPFHTGSARGETEAECPALPLPGSGTQGARSRPISPSRRSFSPTGRMRPWPSERVSLNLGARGHRSQRELSPILLPSERSRRPGAVYSTGLLSAPPLHSPPPPILMQMRSFQLPGPFEQQVAGAGKKRPEWAGAGLPGTGQGWGRGRAGAGPGSRMGRG